MLYSITVDLGDPQGDNEVLMEALKIVGAKQLKALKRDREWIALTNFPLWQVRRTLNRSTRGDDRVEVAPLTGPDVVRTLRDLLNVG